MTLKTISAPTIRDALAEARRLFGADAVMLQSTPAARRRAGLGDGRVRRERAAGVGPAGAPRRRPHRRPRRRRGRTATAPRGGTSRRPRRNALPPRCPCAAEAPRAVQPATFETLARPAAAPPVAAGRLPRRCPRCRRRRDPEPPGAPRAPRSRPRRRDVRSRRAGRRAPPAAPRRAPLVLVGPGGSGKTSLALRLGARPECLGAASVAVIVVAPESGPFVDPGPTFWETGVPCAVVRTADDVREAMRDARRRRPDRRRHACAAARPGAGRCGRAPPRRPCSRRSRRSTCSPCSTPPAAPTRSASTRSPPIGLRPDGLALTRLDEAAPGAARHLRERTGQAVRIASTGDGPDALVIGDALADAPRRSTGSRAARVAARRAVRQPSGWPATPPLPAFRPRLLVTDYDPFILRPASSSPSSAARAARARARSRSTSPRRSSPAATRPPCSTPTSARARAARSSTRRPARPSPRAPPVPSPETASAARRRPG